LTPVLYPAGIYLGADPVWLALAIMSGGALGDNLAPISDTTIVSAYTQEAKMLDVVKSRFPLAAVAALCAMVVLFIMGGGGVAKSLPELQAQTDPKCAPLLIALAVVVFSALKKRHIIESLTYGIVTASAIGISIGTLTLGDLFHIPAKRGMTTGILQDGVNGVVGAVVFVIFIMAAVRVFVEGGLLDDLMRFFERTIAKTVRQAESAIVAVSVVISAVVTANGAALLLVGPTLVKPLGEKFKLAAARRANLMDCAVCSVFYMLPWSLAVLVWYNSVSTAATSIGMTPPPITISFMSPYPWALFLVVLFSIATGWNRRFAPKEQAEES
jgi:Na+/H+ antiporter NhaC